MPRRDQVDAAVGQHIGTQYNTTISTANGPIAIGTEASATTEGLSVGDAIRLLNAVRDAAVDLSDEARRAELLAATEELDAEVQKPDAETGAVVKKAGKLRAVAEKLGVPSISAAVGEAVQAFTAWRWAVFSADRWHCPPSVTLPTGSASVREGPADRYAHALMGCVG